MKPATLGELKRQGQPAHYRSVKDELRDNLIRKLAAGEELFPGIVGYQDSVAPGIVNALLAQHNLILLGLRGQAKSRILRTLTEFLDPEVPVVAGCEIKMILSFPSAVPARGGSQKRATIYPSSISHARNATSKSSHSRRHHCRHHRRFGSHQGRKTGTRAFGSREHSFWPAAPSPQGNIRHE
jgi:hypothetical protein